MRNSYFLCVDLCYALVPFLVLADAMREPIDKKNYSLTVLFSQEQKQFIHYENTHSHILQHSHTQTLTLCRTETMKGTTVLRLSDTQTQHHKQIAYTKYVSFYLSSTAAAAAAADSSSSSSIRSCCIIDWRFQHNNCSVYFSSRPTNISKKN